MEYTAPVRTTKHMNADGTADGCIEYDKSQDYNEFELFLELAKSELLIFWTGPWPELNFKRNSSNPEVNTEFHMKVDITRKITICNVNEGNYLEPQGDPFFEEVLIEFLALESSVNIFMALAMYSVDVYQVSFPANLDALLASFIFWTLSMFSGYFTLKCLSNLGYDILWVGSMFFLLAVQMLVAAWGQIIALLFIGLTAGLLSASVGVTCFLKLCSALDIIWLKKTYLTLAAVYFFYMAEKCFTQGYF